jgi:drug/metabolite transporter (DMT)-like permease
MASVVMESRPRSDWTAWAHGAAGMLIFSASLPATRAAVAALDPWFVTAGRAALAGLLAAGLLALTRSPRPSRRDWAALGVVAFGVVLGFPLFSALALRFVPSSHAIPFIGLLPLSTAGCRGADRTGPAASLVLDLRRAGRGARRRPCLGRWRT